MEEMEKQKQKVKFIQKCMGCFVDEDGGTKRLDVFLIQQMDKPSTNLV